MHLIARSLRLASRRAAPPRPRAPFSPAAPLARSVATTSGSPGSTDDSDGDSGEDLLAGKASGSNLRRAFAARAAAALRYDYFAQRAELEAELEAAGTFRSMKAVAEQQALGFLELLEEYGSPSDEGESISIGATLDNVAAAALAEKADVALYQGYAETAGKEELEQLSEWMCDMSDASERISDRLELVSSLMDEEFEDLSEEEVDAGEQAGKISS